MSAAICQVDDCGEYLLLRRLTAGVVTPALALSHANPNQATTGALHDPDGL